MTFMAVTLMGCNNKLATVNVSGTVTFEGEPLADATINFSPQVQGQGHPAYAITDANGHYKLQTALGKPDAGTTPGVYEISITKVKKPEKGQEYVPSTSSTASGPVTKPKSLIPERYGRTSTSGLKETVVKGNNVFNFDLKSK